MSNTSFKQAVCQHYQLGENQYRRFVLKRALFRRVRLISPFLKIFYPDLLFQEIRLVDKIADATSMREIQEEVDFYQHKYVVNFVSKDALKFRISGMKIMSLANSTMRKPSARTRPKPVLAN